MDQLESIEQTLIEIELQLKQPHPNVSGIAASLEECGSALEMVRLDLSPDQRQSQRSRILAVSKRIRQCKHDLEYLTKPVYVSPEEDLDTSEGLQSHGRKLQNQSIKSLQSTVSTLQDTLALANCTATTLKAQGDQIRHMGDTLYEIDDELGRASRIIRSQQ